ncbi:hypothetical protein D3C81_1783320 [compost metagenome]
MILSRNDQHIRKVDTSRFYIDNDLPSFRFKLRQLIYLQGIRLAVFMDAVTTHQSSPVQMSKSGSWVSFSRGAFAHVCIERKRGDTGVGRAGILRPLVST